VIAVLQGLMSSEVELVPGGVTGDVTDSELAEVCQRSHVSVTGRNTECKLHPKQGGMHISSKYLDHISEAECIWHFW